MEGPNESSEAQRTISISSNHEDQDFLRFDPSNKTAYYNHASEKSISHAEAKMMYRRHMMETSSQQQDALKRARTMPLVENEMDLPKIRRGGSH